MTDNNNQQLDLNSIINEHFQGKPEEANELIKKLGESGNKPVKDGFENLVDKLQRCKTVKEDYKRKHTEIEQLKKNCDILVTLIKSKLSVDKDIMKELISVFSDWSNKPDFKSRFSIEDEELEELTKTQNNLLEDIDKAIEAFNEIADNKHKLPIIDIDDSDKLKELLEDINDPEKIEKLTSKMDDDSN